MPGVCGRVFSAGRRPLCERAPAVGEAALADCVPLGPLVSLGPLAPLPGRPASAERLVLPAGAPPAGREAPEVRALEVERCARPEPAPEDDRAAPVRRFFLRGGVPPPFRPFAIRTTVPVLPVPSCSPPPKRSEVFAEAPQPRAARLAEPDSSLFSDSDGSAHEGADAGQAGVGSQLVAQLGVVGVDVDHVLELGVPRSERVYGQAGQTGIRIEKMADEYVA